MELRLQDATLKGTDEAPRLSSLSLTVVAGERILLMGQTGSGKTPLLKMLAGLVLPTSGKVFWDDKDLASLSPEARRAGQVHFGMVFQSDALFDSMTVLENVSLSLRNRQVAPAEANTRATEVLSTLGLGHALDRLPTAISGGMRKRVGLARALVAKPQIILADDPFAGLDPATTVEVATLLDQEAVTNHRTLIVACPEPPLALGCARWWFLKKGRLVHDGPPHPALLEEDDG